MQNQGRHSEHKKVMLMMLEKNMNRLCKETQELDELHNTVSKLEKDCKEERDKYTELLKYIDEIPCDKMTDEEFGKFFYEHFIHWMDKEQPSAAEPTPPPAFPAIKNDSNPKPQASITIGDPKPTVEDDDEDDDL